MNINNTSIKSKDMTIKSLLEEPRINGINSDNVAMLKMVDVAARKIRNLQERWSEVTKRIEVWLEIKELDDNGEYVNVEVLPTSTNKDRKWMSINSPLLCATGGIYQLKQVQGGSN